MSRDKASLIAKQDGTVERFSDAKLQRCLAVVLGASRQDAKLANPLARAVAMHLAEWAERDPPSSEYVYRCVQAVLDQTGLRRTARCMAVHRRRRRARRKQMCVVYPDAAQSPPVAWRKARVVASMKKHYGVRSPVARMLAGEVETRLFALDFRFAQSTLITALIQNVMMSWGLAAGEFGLVASAESAAVVPPGSDLSAERRPQEE